MSGSPTFQQLFKDLRETLASELAQMEKDTYFAKQRNLLSLVAALYRIGTRIRALQTSLDRFERYVLRRQGEDQQAA